jgi:hypothetical protein
VTRSVRAFRTYGHPLLLIAIWATLEAATIAWLALLQGNPSLESGSLGGTFLAMGILVVFLFLGSRFAWWLAIFFSALGVIVGVGVALVDPGIKPVGIALLQAAALWLIWGGNVEAYVLVGKRRRLIPTR